MSYLAADSLFPEWKIWTQFLDESTEGLRLDGLEESHPIEVFLHGLSFHRLNLFLLQNLQSLAMEPWIVALANISHATFGGYWYNFYLFSARWR